MKARNTAKGNRASASKGKGKVSAKVATKGKATLRKVTRKGKGKASVWQASDTVLAHRAGAAAAKGKLTDTAKVSLVALDKFAADSDVRKRFAKVKVGMTIAEALTVSGGPSRYDMGCAMAKGRFDVRSGSKVKAAAKVARKAAKPAKGKGKG